MVFSASCPLVFSRWCSHDSNNSDKVEDAGETPRPRPSSQHSLRQLSLQPGAVEVDGAATIITKYLKF